MASILKLDTLQTSSGTGVITSPNTIVSPGNVIQVITTTSTSTFTSSVSGAWVSTGLSVSYTPKLATSRILIQFIGAYWQSTGGSYVSVRFTNSGGNTSTPLVYSDLYINSGASITVPIPLTANFIANTTSQITTSIDVYPNGQGVWLNNNAPGNSPTVRSSFTVWEIAQ
jgi:hypothetical protein